MLLPVRGLLVALLLACAGVVLTQLPAHACTCAAGSVRSDVRQADAVFSGVVVDSSRSPADDRGPAGTTYRIDAETLFKGNLSRSRVKVTSPGSSCGLELAADRRYVFFVAESGADLRSDQCSGTARDRAGLVERIEAVAGTGTDIRPPEPAEPAEPEFERVEDAEPAALSRLAAPGVALTLVGLLGLLVVRRRGDRG